MTSIDELAAKVEELSATVVRLERRQADHEKASRLYATNRELDSPKGDPAIKFDPRGWRGTSYQGKPFSQCPPDYLDILAEGLAWSAENPKEGKQQFASLNRSQARIARSWARRLRARAGANVAAEPEPKKSAWGAPPPARSATSPVDDVQAPGESAVPDPLADEDANDPLGGLDDDEEDPLGLESPGP